MAESMDQSTSSDPNLMRSLVSQSSSLSNRLQRTEALRRLRLILKDNRWGSSLVSIIGDAGIEELSNSLVNFPTTAKLTAQCLLQIISNSNPTNLKGLCHVILNPTIRAFSSSINQPIQLPDRMVTMIYLMRILSSMISRLGSLALINLSEQIDCLTSCLQPRSPPVNQNSLQPIGRLVLGGSRPIVNSTNYYEPRRSGSKSRSIRSRQSYSSLNSDSESSSSSSSSDSNLNQSSTSKDLDDKQSVQVRLDALSCLNKILECDSKSLYQFWSILFPASNNNRKSSNKSLINLIERDPHLIVRLRAIEVIKKILEGSKTYMAIAEESRKSKSSVSFISLSSQIASITIELHERLNLNLKNRLTDSTELICGLIELGEILCKVTAYHRIIRPIIGLIVEPVVELLNEKDRDITERSRKSLSEIFINHYQQQGQKQQMTSKNNRNKVYFNNDKVHEEIDDQVEKVIEICLDRLIELNKNENYENENDDESHNDGFIISQDEFEWLKLLTDGLRFIEKINYELIQKMLRTLKKLIFQRKERCKMNDENEEENQEFIKLKVTLVELMLIKFDYDYDCDDEDQENIKYELDRGDEESEKTKEREEGEGIGVDYNDYYRKIYLRLIQVEFNHIGIDSLINLIKSTYNNDKTQVTIKSKNQQRTLEKNNGKCFDGDADVFKRSISIKDMIRKKILIGIVNDSEVKSKVIENFKEYENEEEYNEDDGFKLIRLIGLVFEKKLIEIETSMDWIKEIFQKLLMMMIVEDEDEKSFIDQEERILCKEKEEEETADEKKKKAITINYSILSWSLANCIQTMSSVQLLKDLIFINANERHEADLQADGNYEKGKIDVQFLKVLIKAFNKVSLKFLKLKKNKKDIDNKLQKNQVHSVRINCIRTTGSLIVELIKSKLLQIGNLTGNHDDEKIIEHLENLIEKIFDQLCHILVDENENDFKVQWNTASILKEILKFLKADEANHQHINDEDEIHEGEKAERDESLKIKGKKGMMVKEFKNERVKDEETIISTLKKDLMVKKVLQSFWNCLMKSSSIKVKIQVCLGLKIFNETFILNDSEKVDYIQNMLNKEFQSKKGENFEPQNHESKSSYDEKLEILNFKGDEGNEIDQLRLKLKTQLLSLLE